MRKAVRVGAVVAVVAGLISAQQFVLLPVRALLAHALANSLHWPMFAAIAFALSVLIPRWTRVLGWSLLLAVATEVAQLLTGRSAAWSDLAIDVAGTVSGLAAWQVYVALGRDRRRVALGLAVVLLGAAVSAVGPVRVWVKLQQRDRLAPKLIDFSADPGLYFLRTVCEHARVPPPAGWDANDEPRVLQLLLADERWPGLSLVDTLRDWSGYGSLRIDLFLESDGPVPIHLRAVELDAVRLGPILHFELQPGPNRRVVPLEQLIAGDRSRILQLILYSEREYAGATLYLASLALER